MREIFRQTPNVSKGRKITPTGIVLHHTAGSYAGSVNWCLNPASQVSYHCIIDLNGDRTFLAKETERAWHAGKSSYRGVTDCNSFMIGIAVSGNTNTRKLTPEEIASVATLCVEYMHRWKFPIENITTHRAVSPGRKNDVSPEAEKQILEAVLKIIWK
jgi:N-acetylmuramoyl-L-alanine amidase